MENHNLIAFFVVMVLAVVSMAIVTSLPEQAEGARVYAVHPLSAQAGAHARGLVAVRHEFNTGKFSAVIPDSRVAELSELAILELVPLYHISGKALGKQPASRTCTPSAQRPWGIARVNGGSGGAGVTVAVLDTGVKTNHMDLKNRIADCKDFTKGISVRNGCSDGAGHGTHVAGTVAADGGSDGKGIIGVAPLANVLAYKVCGNDGSCWSDDIAAAVEYAANKGAHIVSMSLGGDAPMSLLADAINYAESRGVLVVAAAGNDGPSDGTIDYPGAYAHVVAAAASDSTDAIASFSSRGINYDTTPLVVEDRDVEFAAPGVSVESTWNDGCYRTISGTSMATPHVSGLAAALWQGSNSATRTFLQQKALAGPDLGRPGDDPDAGFGMPTV
ncbi:S8 family serine peptidase [Candidatus Woesearchaeota archaeon]|nr:S8 family serine peptidase [Candidatus Woesearchaeota archaeon]